MGVTIVNIDPKRVWLISGLHLGNREGFPINPPKFYEESLFETLWNCVRKDDVLCLLGNIADNSKSHWLQSLQNMPGHKILIQGNHDKNRTQWYKKYGFALVVALGDCLVVRHELGNILLSNIPVFESVLASYDSSRFMGMARRLNKMYDVNSCILNIHGFTHGMSTPNGKTFDVSVEAINYAPILLDQVIDIVFRGAKPYYQKEPGIVMANPALNPPWSEDEIGGC